MVGVGSTFVEFVLSKCNRVKIMCKCRTLYTHQCVEDFCLSNIVFKKNLLTTDNVNIISISSITKWLTLLFLSTKSCMYLLNAIHLYKLGWCVLKNQLMIMMLAVTATETFKSCFLLKKNS